MPMRKPTRPGAMLAKEFLEPLGLSQSALAHQIGLPAEVIDELVRGKRPVTAELALDLSSAFGTSAEFWQTLQIKYDRWASQR